MWGAGSIPRALSLPNSQCWCDVSFELNTGKIQWLLMGLVRFLSFNRIEIIDLLALNNSKSL